MEKTKPPATNLDRIYQATGDAAMRDAYDQWAQDYDRDVGDKEYVTPTRIAEALATFVCDRATPVMDYGCGTGLSGVALKKTGFSTIDGADLSQKMLDIARDTGVYRDLSLVEPDAPPASQIADYPAITATGVISRGAAPASLYDAMLGVMKPGALLAFSINDLSMDDPDYSGLVASSVQDGKVDLLFEQHGPHLAKYGKNSGSTVYVIERAA